MIEQVDRAVERFFREKTPLPDSTAAISFETPDRDWGAARTRPTVSVFLWEIVRSPSMLRSGPEQRVDDSGSRQRRPINPIVDLHYLVTAWASEPRDEHQLLGALLECILAHGRLPDDVLPEVLVGKRCGLGLAPYDARPPGELWTSLNSGTRAAVHLEVSLPLEVFAWRDVAAPVESIEARTAARTRDSAPSFATPPPVLTRRRANGAIVMEGRTEKSDAEQSESEHGDTSLED